MTRRATPLATRGVYLAEPALPFVARAAFGFAAKQSLLQIPDSGMRALQFGAKRCPSLLALRLHLAQDTLVTRFAPRSAGHGTFVHGLVVMKLHDQLVYGCRVSVTHSLANGIAPPLLASGLASNANESARMRETLAKIVFGSHPLRFSLDAVMGMPNIYVHFYVNERQVQPCCWLDRPGLEAR